jgi:hypothetical protein
MTNYPQFKAGQKVRNCYGETLTVISQNGCMVWTQENHKYLIRMTAPLKWYHPAKLFAVEAN